MKVEMFSSNSNTSLGLLINDWLGRHKSVNVHDIKYQVSPDAWNTHNAMVIYSYEV